MTSTRRELAAVRPERPGDIAAIRRVNEEANKILRDPEFERKTKDMGLVPLPSSRDEFRQVQARDIDKWRDRVRKSGAQVD